MRVLRSLEPSGMRLLPQKLTTYLFSQNRLLVGTLSALLLLSFGSYALAAALYHPGDNVTDPTCAPGSTDCYVDSVASIGIGSVVGGGDGNEVLYQNADKQLSSNADFVYDETQGMFTVGFDGNPYLRIDPGAIAPGFSFGDTQGVTTAPVSFDILSMNPLAMNQGWRVAITDNSTASEYFSINRTTAADIHRLGTTATNAYNFGDIYGNTGLGLSISDSTLYSGRATELTRGLSLGDTTGLLGGTLFSLDDLDQTISLNAVNGVYVSSLDDAGDGCVVSSGGWLSTTSCGGGTPTLSDVLAADSSNGGIAITGSNFLQETSASTNVLMNASTLTLIGTDASDNLYLQGIRSGSYAGQLGFDSNGQLSYSPGSGLNPSFYAQGALGQFFLGNDGSGGGHSTSLAINDNDKTIMIGRNASRSSVSFSGVGSSSALTAGGISDHSGNLTTTVKIDSVNTFQMVINITSGTFAVTDQIQAPAIPPSMGTYGTVSVASSVVSGVQTLIITGSHIVGPGWTNGLVITSNSGGRATITSVTGPGDTVEVQDSLGADTQYVPITGTAQPATHGVEFKFSTITGHTNGDQWSWVSTTVPMISTDGGANTVTLNAAGGITLGSLAGHGNGFLAINNSGLLSWASSDLPTIDATLTGDGSGGSPLGLNLSNANTWLGQQTFSTDTTVLGNIFSKGTVWTERTVTPSGMWTSVAYGNGRYVAVGYDGTAMWSPDGINWTAGTGVPGNHWYSVAYGNGLFVAVADNGLISNNVMTSADGVSWTAQTSSATAAWRSVAYGNGHFAAVGYDGTAMWSSNGVNWTNATSIHSTAWEAVTYGNGTFVAVSDATTDSVNFMTSPDGVTWTPHTSIIALDEWRTVTYGNGLFVAGGDSSIMTSPDGVTWTPHTSSPGTWSTSSYGNGLFVVVAFNGGVITSPDGITWTPRTSPTMGNLLGVVYGNGMFVGVAGNYPGGVMTSGYPDQATQQFDNIYQGGITVNGTITFPSLVSCAGLSTNANGVMNCSSDETLKDIHNDFTAGLDAINKLHPKTYSWKEGTYLYDGGVNYSGFIAQDVQAAIPEGVSVGSQGQLQLNTTTVLATVVNAIKDLDLKVEPLTSIDPTQSGSLADLISRFLGSATNGLASLFVGTIHTNQICVGSTCLNEAQVQQILNATGGSAGSGSVPDAPTPPSDGAGTPPADDQTVTPPASTPDPASDLTPATPPGQFKHPS